MVIDNWGDSQADAGAGVLGAVIVLLRPRDCALGVVTAGTAGVPEGPRD
jgi:hypothetical protein